VPAVHVEAVELVKIVAVEAPAVSETATIANKESKNFFIIKMFM
jgi:hypothetical protein